MQQFFGYMILLVGAIAGALLIAALGLTPVAGTLALLLVLAVVDKAVDVIPQLRQRTHV